MRPVAQIAQSVEQGIENPRVGGSIPSLGTTFRFQVMPSTTENTQEARLVRAFCFLWFPMNQTVRRNLSIMLIFLVSMSLAVRSIVAAVICQVATHCASGSAA